MGILFFGVHHSTVGHDFDKPLHFPSLSYFCLRRCALCTRCTDTSQKQEASTARTQSDVAVKLQQIATLCPAPTIPGSGRAMFPYFSALFRWPARLY